MPIKIQGLLRKQCVAALAICDVNSMQEKRANRLSIRSLCFLKEWIYKENNAPKIVKNTIIQMKEITKPAIERPFGRLNTPIKEKITPRIQRIQLRMGTQQKIRPIRANTKPAVPIPFFCAT